MSDDGIPNDAHIIALEWLKHLITLSSSIIVFSGTIVGLVLDELNWSLWILGISWLFFIVVILLSLETVSVITYSRINDDDSWAAGRGRNLARVAKECFVLGMIAFVLFSATSMYMLLG